MAIVVLDYGSHPRQCMLCLQVSMAAEGLTEGFDMQSCWVDLMSSKIPVLVVAVDDALLTCADRVLQHWKKPGTSVSF